MVRRPGDWHEGAGRGGIARAVRCPEPLITSLAALFFIVCIPVVAYRMLRHRPCQKPGIFLLNSLVVLLVSNGVSGALYGTSDDQASSPSNSQSEPKNKESRQEPAREETKATPPETTEEAATASAEKTKDRSAAKPKPKPKPQSKLKPKPKPRATTSEHKITSPYEPRSRLEG
jgi:outer membrane biosynthesis protein TonB